MTLVGSQALVNGDYDPERCQDPITRAIAAVDHPLLSGAWGLLRSTSVDDLSGTALSNTLISHTFVKERILVQEGKVRYEWGWSLGPDQSDRSLNFDGGHVRDNLTNGTRPWPPRQLLMSNHDGSRVVWKVADGKVQHQIDGKGSSPSRCLY